METETAIQPEDKYELENYLRAINTSDPKTLDLRAREIVDTVLKVMAPYYLKEELQGAYYRQIIRRLEKALKERDFRIEFPSAIKGLITYIEYE